MKVKGGRQTRSTMLIKVIAIDIGKKKRNYAFTWVRT